MRIVFMGTPEAAVPSMESIIRGGHTVVAVYCQPDRPSGRGNKITFSPVKQFSIEHQIDILQPHSLKTTEASDVFRSHDADAAVVVAYGRVLPEQFLSAYRYGAINLHFSLLPKYRGAAPVNWAIVNGETETGVTTMRMDRGLDTGPILMQRTTPIGERETAIELTNRLAEIGSELLAATLERIESLIPMPQDDLGATIAPILKREDGHIDWNLTAQKISDRIRGFLPFPGSFTFVDDKKLSLLAAELAHPVPEACLPGQIVMTHDRQLLIGCGDGTLLAIKELQLEGRRKMNAVEFINGVRQLNGKILG